MKVTKQLIPDSWKTKSLVITTATVDDISDLEKVYLDGFEQLFVYKEKSPKKGYIKNRIIKPLLPPKGKAEQEQFQIIRTKTGKCIGYIGTYNGWPNKNALWINDLFLHRSAQKKGYGQELVKALVSYAKKSSKMKELHCRVSLKNWSAIQFWVKMKFSTITAYDGDKKNSNKNSADLLLKRDL